MAADRHIWRIWADSLHRWGVHDLVATLLEAMGPLTLVGAQLIYLGQPLLTTFLPDQHISAAARLLEDSTRGADFVAYLREAD